MTKLAQERLIRTAIYLFFGVALLLATLAFGRYVSKGTYVDTNDALLISTLMTGLTFYAISGIIRPRPRRR